MLLAVAACGVFFFSLLWAGNKVFATDSLAGATPARTTFPTTSAEDDTAASPREKSGSQKKKSGRSGHDPRVHHVHADMVSAREAVLHASDIEEEWEPAALPKDGPPCRQNNPDLSRFTITGEARTIFKSPAGVAKDRVARQAVCQRRSSRPVLQGAQQPREAAVHSGRNEAVVARKRLEASPCVCAARNRSSHRNPDRHVSRELRDHALHRGKARVSGGGIYLPGPPCGRHASVRLHLLARRLEAVPMRARRGQPGGEPPVSHLVSPR